MTTRDDDHDGAIQHGGGYPADAVLMLIVGLDARREQAIRAIERIAPQTRIETARSALDALLRATRKRPADLLVLDLAMDGPAAPALIRHLARIAQPTDVRVFDDVAQTLPNGACDVWAWSEVESVLQRWFDDWPSRGTAPE